MSIFEIIIVLNIVLVSSTVAINGVTGFILLLGKLLVTGGIGMLIMIIFLN